MGTVWGNVLLFQLVFFIMTIDASSCLTKRCIPACDMSIVKSCPLDELSPHRVRCFIKKFYYDSYFIAEELFSLESMKFLTAFVPFYLFTRHFDRKVHNKFYIQETHKNKHTPPRWLRVLLHDDIMSIPFVLYAVKGWFDVDPYRRRASELFTTGIFWTVGTKLIFKMFRIDANLRPRHEHFSRDCRTHGGNPSGHTSTAAFMATYLGLLYGPRFAVPLSLYTGLVAGLSIANNHHYLSQIISGTFLGALIGSISYKVLTDFKLPENLSCGITVDRRGGVGLMLAYDF